MKKLLKCLLIILFLGSIGANVYLLFFVDDNKLELPIYEVAAYDDSKFITYNIDSVYDKQYKLVNKLKCKYDLCYWYDYDVPTVYGAKWIYYDNNAANEGGYYIYDQESNKTIYGPYEEIEIDIDETSSSEILQGAYLYSKDGKVGYFDLRGLNQMIFDVKYDNIESSEYHTFYVTESNNNLTIYSLIDNKLKKISDSQYDDFTFVKNNWTGYVSDYVITQKNNKYNFVYDGYDSKVNETTDNYDFLNVYPHYYDLYFVYSKDGETYISKTNIYKVLEKNSLEIDTTFNYKISSNVEKWSMVPNEEEEELYIHPMDNGTKEYYVIDLKEDKIEKEYYKNDDNNSAKK